MSSNDSIGSNTTNTTDVYIYNYTLPDIFYIYCGVTIFIVVVGTLLNLWFLLALLYSRETRSRLRNKIICNSLVLHLVDSVIALPLNVVPILNERFRSCIFYSIMNHVVLIQDFIGNWLLVMLIVVFIAQIQDFSPERKLSPRTITISTVGLLIIPWVASLVLVPVIVHEHYKHLPWAESGCSTLTFEAHQVLKSVDTAVPIFLAVLLVTIAVFLRYKRFTRGYSSGSMQTELISRCPDIDNHIAYIVATAVCILCDLIQLIYSLNIFTIINYGYTIWLVIDVVSFTMSHSRVMLMPLPWLLLPDIRQQIRTWRPWNRSTPGTDLVVFFRKEEN